MSSIALVPQVPSLTLYAVEDALAALVECIDTVTPDQEAEFAVMLGHAMTAAIDKRDAVGHFLAHVQSQIELAKDEKLRLAARQKTYERVIEKMEGYIVHIIEERATPNAKGKVTYPKLEGATVSFSIKKCPDSIEVTDAMLIPPAYTNVAMTLPSELLTEVIDALPMELANSVLGLLKSSDVTVDKNKAKAEIKAGAKIKGLRIAPPKRTLVIS